ncbi:MAG: AAA family ATPase [Spirochaetales bacterium]|nr:AAA family ATPase [Spirochaetales bacterium]
MRYSGFKIRNFKGIREIDIDFERLPETNIFTLVGLNESGKTTVLEAINFFSQENAKDTHRFIPKSKKHKL